MCWRRVSVVPRVAAVLAACLCPQDESNQAERTAGQGRPETSGPEDHSRPLTGRQLSLARKYIGLIRGRADKVGGLAIRGCRALPRVSDCWEGLSRAQMQSM